MDTNSEVVSLNDKEILTLFLADEDLARRRILFNRFFGNPIWCFFYRPQSKKRGPMLLHPRTAQLWADPRLERLTCKKQLLKFASLRSRQDSFHLKCKRHSLLNYGIPISVAGNLLGVLILAHIRPGSLNRENLNLFHASIRSHLEKVVKLYEVKRLSESVRPRAIALSTVHTVHRVITSTLNLDELLDRLAHLSSQVLRAQTCAIYLVQTNGGRALIERAYAGPASARKKSGRKKPPRKIRAGQGIEGYVFQSARQIVRRNLICVPLIEQEVTGIMVLTHRKDGKPFDNFDQEILSTLAEEAVIAIKNAQLYEEQKKVTLGAIQSLASILGTRFAHSPKLKPEALLKLTLSIAQELHLSEEEIQALHYATLLKDAGKIGLPDDLITKPTKLTGEEYKLIRQHPIKGAKIVQSFESLKPVAPIILYAHEHYDGSGYPQGLRENEIPIGARILAVVNAFDALIAGRPYRSRATVQEAIEELKNHRGSQFDPRVIDVFERVISRPVIKRILSKI